MCLTKKVEMQITITLFQQLNTSINPLIASCQLPPTLSLSRSCCCQSNSWRMASSSDCPGVAQSRLKSAIEFLWAKKIISVDDFVGKFLSLKEQKQYTITSVHHLWAKHCTNLQGDTSGRFQTLYSGPVKATAALNRGFGNSLMCHPEYVLGRRNSLRDSTYLGVTGLTTAIFGDFEGVTTGVTMDETVEVTIGSWKASNNNWHFISVSKWIWKVHAVWFKRGSL